MYNILIICSKYPNKDRAYGNIFIKEQVEAIKRVEPIFNFEIFQINPSGNKSNYFKAIYKLRNMAFSKKYDLFHAYYGLSGIPAIWQHQVPLVVTYVGSDINDFFSRMIAKCLVQKRTDFSIFVTKKLLQIGGNPSHSVVIPLGVSFKDFYPFSKDEARLKLSWLPNRKYIVFASTFERPEKNCSLAKKSISLFNNDSIELVELKNYTRQEVNFVLNAADLLLLTSLSEGSPQIVKEAMACNLPVVSTDVGDVKEVMGGTEGCFITTFEPEDVAKNIGRALNFGKRTNGRENIKHLEIDNIARRVADIYKKALKKE